MLFVCHTIIDFLCCSCDVMCSQEGDIGNFFFFWLVLIFINPLHASPYTTTTAFPPLSCCPLSSAVYFSPPPAVSAGTLPHRRSPLCRGRQMQWRSCREEKRELKWREGPQREERRGEVGEGRGETEKERRQKMTGDGWDNRELALPVVSKGTQCWIRPWPVITARWALEGRGQRERLKNKIAAADVCRVWLQHHFILKFSAVCVWTWQHPTRYSWKYGGTLLDCITDMSRLHGI